MPSPYDTDDVKAVTGKDIHLTADGEGHVVGNSRIARAVDSVKDRWRLMKKASLGKPVSLAKRGR